MNDKPRRCVREFDAKVGPEVCHPTDDKRPERRTRGGDEVVCHLMDDKSAATETGSDCLPRRGAGIQGENKARDG
jgi:hypothetical protein